MQKPLLLLVLFFSQNVWANNDTTAKKYCKPRIIGMSPNKVISIGWDHEFSQTLRSSAIGSYDKDETANYTETTKFRGVSGLRFSAKVPIINKPKIVWQFGLNYWNSNYKLKYSTYRVPSHRLGVNLDSTDLKTKGINTSIYKPLNERSFIIFLASADLNGDYTFKNKQPLKYLKYSVVAMYGQRPHDRKQWALGVARGYGAGQLTLLPVVMFNYTSVNNKWGTEILLPARAWYRRTINKNSLLRAGYELEGASYRLNYLSTSTNNYELRRGELRTKIEYQCKLYRSFWLAVQTGYASMLNYNVEDIGSDGKDLSSAFAGKKKYAMLNDLPNFMFINLAINFVSL